MPALLPLSWLAIGAQRVLRPGRPAMNVAKAFATQRYDSARSAALAPSVAELFPDSARGGRSAR
jgi:hypothetical protein